MGRIRFRVPDLLSKLLRMHLQRNLYAPKGSRILLPVLTPAARVHRHSRTVHLSQAQEGLSRMEVVPIRSPFRDGQPRAFARSCKTSRVSAGSLHAQTTGRFPIAPPVAGAVCL